MKLLTFSSAGLTGVALAVLVGFTGPVTGQPVATHTMPPDTRGVTAEQVTLSSGTQDILKLSRAKVNDDVTVTFIKNGNRRFDLSAAEIVYLRQEGVSDRVLAAMLAHKPQQASATQAPEQSASTPVASAPQYVEPPTTTAVVETTPSSVYVVPSTPAYYSFYNPSPYWYDPWPYYWGWSYPYFSFGWYWGGCNYGYYGYYGDCWDNDQCDNGDSSSSANNGNPPHADGNATRVPPTRGGSPNDQSGTMTSNQRPSPGVNQTASTDGARSTATRSARNTPAGRSAGEAGSGGSQPAGSGTATAAASARSQGRVGERSLQANRTVASRTGGSPAATASTAGSQSVRPTSVWTSGANDRSVATRPAETQRTVQLARGYSARPTSTWSAGTSQSSVTRPTSSPNAVAVAPSRQVNTRPTTTWSQPGGQPANRYAARPATSYQRGNTSPSYSPRASGQSASVSRPSMSAPVRSMGNSGAIRSGGSSGGGSAPRMSAGGGTRGGGGRQR